MNIDLYMDGRAKVSSYKAMIESLLETGLPPMTHREAWRRQGEDGRYLCIRHDVDHNIEMALYMARIEHALGVCSTYYLLPPGDYNKDENYYGRLQGKLLLQTDRLCEVAKEIASLGHEIGLHNDFLQLSRRLSRPLNELILEQIAYFRGAGIEVVGSASHGSRFARGHSYVNYEIFADCIRPNSENRSVKFEDGSQFELFKLQMADLGLIYEAYSLKRQVYISDTGSRLFVGSEYHDSLTPAMMTDLIGTSSKVVALFHPEWWRVLDHAALPTFLSRDSAVVIGARENQGITGTTVFGDHLTANCASDDKPISFSRPDGKPFRVAIRGDCCSRRAVVMNKDLFPLGVELIINEKCPNASFVDAIHGHFIDSARGDEVSDTAKMSGSLKHYYIAQFNRSVLGATDLDMLIFDNYSDMNFERWAHREEGWSLWVHPKFIRDPDVFKKCFEKIGYSTLEEATDAICAVISHIRQNNPGLPVMFLNQPVEYYPKLENRMDFYTLGERVAERCSGIYAARPLTKDELVCADIGSCGPGFTLHFSGATYKRMIEDAWAKGLGKHLVDGMVPKGGGAVDAVSVGKGVATKAQEESSNCAVISTSHSARSSTELQREQASLLEQIISSAIFPPKSLTLGESFPTVLIGYQDSLDTCLVGCKDQVNAAFKTYAQYFRHPEIDPTAPIPRFTPMLIDVADIQDFDAWESHIKTFGKGARLRQKRKALALGCYVKMFAWKTFIPDVHDINHSKASRSGGAMRGSYLRSIEEMGGEPDRLYPIVPPKCSNHWSLQFGTFIAEPGHRQGGLEVNERLVAYISLRRSGDVLLYSQILGHGDFLNHGVLVLLHHEVIRWVSENGDGLAKGLRYVMYGGLQNGGESLLQFKRQAGFQPHNVLAFRSKAPSIV